MKMQQLWHFPAIFVFAHVLIFDIVAGKRGNREAGIGDPDYMATDILLLSVP
jgi:hypothetical protein